MRLLLVLVRVSGCRLTGDRLPDGKAKAEVLAAIAPNPKHVAMAARRIICAQNGPVEASRGAVGSSRTSVGCSMPRAPQVGPSFDEAVARSACCGAQSC